jgi:Virulence-associated protein E
MPLLAVSVQEGERRSLTAVPDEFHKLRTTPAGERVKLPAVIPTLDDDEEDQTAYWAYDVAENAFNCIKGDWPEYNKDGSVKLCLANTIAALRWYLEDNHIELKFDVWRKYNITIPSSAIDDPHVDWLNEIYREHKVFFSTSMFQNAMRQLARYNKFHSQIEYYWNLPKWDQVPRIETFVKDCLTAEGTKLEIHVIKMHLIASVRRILIPGAAYDMCICLIGEQGIMKSKMLSILYGENNVLAEDISCKDVKTQSEKTRQGINCVELPETLGDGSRQAVDKVKAFITSRFYRAREAYGRPENMRPIPKTFVIWHTRNTDQFLEDPTGHRRFHPMPLYSYIDETWLRQNRDQLWAEVIELEERGRSDYYDDNISRNITVQRNDEKFPDIFLPEEFWEEAAELGRRHMKGDVALTSYGNLLNNLINQSFVITTPKATFVLLDDLRPYLHISEKQWIGKSQNVTAILKALGWEKKQIWWNGKNQNGYELTNAG